LTARLDQDHRQTVGGKMGDEILVVRHPHLERATRARFIPGPEIKTMTSRRPGLQAACAIEPIHSRAAVLVFSISSRYC